MRILLTLCLALGACGDDSDDLDMALASDASCATHDLQGGMKPDGGPEAQCAGTPCGGDLTGTWQVEAVCATGDGDGTFFGCKPGSVHYIGLAVSGTFTFDGAGNVTTNADEHAVATAHLPLSCYGLQDCATVESLAKANGIQASCVSACTADPACDCAVELTASAVMLMGSVVTDGAGGLTLTLGKETIPGHYCVSGDRLWVQGTRFGGVDYRYSMRRVP
jgi:hypothetical protein